MAPPSTMLNELRAILPQPRREELCRSWALAIVMFTQTMNGLGYIWIIVLDSVVPNIYFNGTLGHSTSPSGDLVMYMTPFTGMAYIMPILVGLYADNKGERYETMLFGKCIKLTGTAMRVIIILLLHFQEKFGIIESDILQATYLVTVLFNYFSIWVVVPTTLVFGAMQVNQKNEGALTSYFRWMFCVWNVGCVIGSFVWIIMVTNDDTLGANSILYYTSMMLVVDTLSLVVLIFGKRTYNRNNMKGCRSLREAFRIIKIHIFCGKLPMEEEVEDPNVRMLTRRLERLMVRKFILLMAVLVVGSLFQIIWIEMMSDPDVYTHDDSGKMVVDVRGEYISDAIYIMPIITVPVLEIIGRVSQCCSLRTEYTRALKLVGLGNFAIAIAVCIGGYLHEQIRNRGVAVSVYWQLPEFIIAGIASVLVFPTVFEMSYRESLPGLGTLTTGLSLAMAYGLSTTILVLRMEGADTTSHTTHQNAQEIEMYGLGAGMVVILIIIYLPISIWFTKVRKDIRSTASELDAAAPNVQTPAGPDVEILDVTLLDESETVRTFCAGITDTADDEESLVVE